MRQAVEFGPTAKVHREHQMTLVPEPVVSGDGSVLTVNVTTPDPGAALPVLVWLHGGGFTEGSPASPWYEGHGLAERGVVTVTVGYRLGFEGFGHLTGSPDNRAVRDWLCALEWVQQNIGAFGGDPVRVTVGGQSAGAAAVLTLLAAPAAAGLISGAFASSPVSTGIPLDHAQAATQRVAAAARVSADEVGFASVGRERLAAAERRAGGAGPARLRRLLADGLPLGPVVDGDVLPRPPEAALRTGAGADVPLLIGANDDESVMSAAALPRSAAGVPAGLLLAALGVLPARCRAYLNTLRATGSASLGSRFAVGRYATDQVFRRVVLTAAQQRAAHADVAAAAADTWVYRFSWGSPAHRMTDRAQNSHDLAVHCLDLPFWFDVLDHPDASRLTGGTAPQALADEMHGLLVEFVTSGRAPWPAWNRQGPARVFGNSPRQVETGAYASVECLLPPATS